MCLINDDVNTFAVVRFLMMRLCGHDAAGSLSVANAVHTSGSADIATYEAQQQAEELVAVLQRHGLRAAVRRPS
ncbi:hypothetical protein Lesp02_53970 [Lentzea sp. NBRC 105346]|nr:hypothetical protein Lesp02_53970 [Lentzea sp. NBRC 105346]